MKRCTAARFGARVAVAALALVAGAGAAPVGAETTGGEQFRLAIVARSVDGMRTPVSAVLAAQGVYRGVAKVVERENLPGDPDNVSRDDLVFPDGTMHVRVVNGEPEFDVDARTCVFTVRVPQVVHVEGGSGRFADAEGELEGTVTARGITARDENGDCSLDRPPLLEVDTGTAEGSLSL